MKYFLFLSVARWQVPAWALAFAGLLLALSQPAQAQVTNPDPLLNNPAAPVMIRPDTAVVRKPTRKERRAAAAADSAKRTERLFGFHVTRPQKAGFLALAPGAGQIYNKRYWKIPIVYGMVGGLGYWVYYQQTYFKYFVRASGMTTAQLTAADNGLPAEIKVLSAANIQNGLIFARRYRDLSILISGLGYGLQILDAVVDAHLHDFDVSDNLSLNWQPTLLMVPGQPVPAPGVTVVLRAK